MHKSLLNFGDLDLVYKAMAFEVAYRLGQWMKCLQICINIITVTSLRDFRYLDLSYSVIVLYVEYLLNQWMDFLQTCISISQ